MNDLVTNPFGTGAVTEVPASMRIEEQRAIAEIQAAALVAKASPRDPRKAVDMILTDCQRLTLAEQATYQYVRGGTNIEGASIRLIETVARRWKNIQAGVAQLYVQDNKSFCRAWAVDCENNTRDDHYFWVEHRRDTKNGSYVLTDERDIRELWLNIGARHKRSCIQSLIDGDVIAAAVDQCKRTLAAHGEVTPERLTGMLEKFAAVGVTKSMIERRIQRNLESMSPAMLLKLGQIYNGLREGIGSVSDWFTADDVVDMKSDTTRVEQTKEQLRKRDAGTSSGTGTKSTTTSPSAKSTTAAASPPKGTSSTAPPKATAKKKPSYAEVAEAMRTASSREALEAAGDAAQVVVDPKQREELEALYEARAREFDEAAEARKPVDPSDGSEPQ